VKLILVLQNVVKDLFDHGEGALENDVTEIWASKNSLFHVLQCYVLKSKDLLCVVICNHGPRHSPNLALHYVLEEASTN
jgi:hypothetical protein